MKFQPTIRARAKLLTAAIVCAVLGSVVVVASRASHQATVAKRAQFDAADAIQTAARERKGSKVADGK